MGLLLVGSISEVGTCSKVNQGERKCLHHRTTTVGRFKVSEMNGKGRLIVSKIGEYSHLTMPSQIFDEKTQRNHLEISVHKQKKKKKPSPCLLPLSPIHLFLLFYSLTAQALFRRANYGTGPLSSPVAALASRYNQGKHTSCGRRQIWCIPVCIYPSSSRPLR